MNKNNTTINGAAKSVLLLWSGVIVGIRNIRRSLFILSLIVSCGLIMFLSYSFLQDIYRGVRIAGIFQNGHLVIMTEASRAGGADARQKVISNADMNAVINKIATIEAVRQHIRALDINGLLGTEFDSAIVFGVGADTSALFGPLRSVNAVEGRVFFPTDSQSQRAILGKNLKRNVGVDAGEWAVLQTITVDGAVNLLDVEIIGFSQGFSSAVDDGFIALPFSYAQIALQTDGAHRIHLLLADESHQAAAKEELQHFIRVNNLPLATLGWQEIYPLLDEVSTFYNLIFNIVTIIIVALSIISIFALITLNVFSRARELGALRATGITKIGLLQLLAGEIGAIYLLATILWIGLGFGIGALVNSVDLAYTVPFSDMEVPFSFYLRARHAVIPLFSTLFSVAAASAVPLYRASRLNIVEVLRAE